MADERDGYRICASPRCAGLVHVRFGQDYCPSCQAKAKLKGLDKIESELSTAEELWRQSVMTREEALGMMNLVQGEKIDRDNDMTNHDHMTVDELCNQPNTMISAQQLADSFAQKNQNLSVIPGWTKNTFRFIGPYGECQVYTNQTLREWRCVARLLTSNPYELETGKVPKTAEELHKKLTDQMSENIRPQRIHTCKKILSEGIDAGQ